MEFTEVNLTLFLTNIPETERSIKFLSIQYYTLRWYSVEYTYTAPIL